MKNYYCEHCGAEAEVSFSPSVNVGEHPELGPMVANGDYFVWECPRCGKKNLFSGPFLYTDPVLKLVIFLSNEKVSSEGEIPGYTARQVRSVGELIEKIKITSAGLDDIAVEICKYVTQEDMGKDVELKFFRMEGPDHDLIFAYPEEDRMEMVQIGFSVYQDCCGILSRNPSISDAARGLVRVDREFIADFIA